MRKFITCTILAALAAMPLAASAQAQHLGVAPVVNPDVPYKITFGGEEISLDPIDRWERLDRELTSLSYTHGNTLLTIKRANRYFPEMAPILEKYGVPLDLLYLACTESMLDTRAYSAAKAAGLWQFIPDTGRSYGLEINDYVDERYHTAKATEAAAKMLKGLHNKFGNWESACASYNAGPGRITTELSKQGQESSFDLYLVSETSRYMFRILAYKMIMEHPSKYGFHLERHQLYQPIECEEVEVSTPVEDWPAWAKDHGMSFLQLRDLNPWIRAKSLPNKSGKTYRVKVPVKDAMSRSKQKKTLYNKNWVK